jgi:DNA-binding phage protein
LKKGQIDGVNDEMRELIANMEDMTEEEYYSSDGYFAPIDVKGMIEESCEDPEFAEHWTVRCLERELRRTVVQERKNQNLTQKELAEKAHLTQQQLSRLELGHENSPSLATIFKVLNALNIEIKFVPRPVSSDQSN